MATNPCLEELTWLKSIASSLNNIYKYMTGQISSPSFRSNQDGWTVVHTAKSWHYTKVITYTGSANTCDLNISFYGQLNRMEQIWNDATTKDFSVRVFPDPSSTAYVELDTQTGNTATNRLRQYGTEYKYPPGFRLRIYSATNTNAKTDTINIQIDEL